MQPLIHIVKVNDINPQNTITSIYSMMMIRRRLSTTLVVVTAVILLSTLNGSNGFHQIPLLPPRHQQHSQKRHSFTFLRDAAVAPLSENATASSWIPSNGKVKEDSLETVLVKESTATPTAAAGATSSFVDSTAAVIESAATAEATSSFAAVHSRVLQKKNNSRIAVILNVNARAVTESMAETIRELLAKSNRHGRVFVTRTAQEAMDAATEIITDSSYNLVIPVGGDGTLTTVINALVNAIIQQQQQQQQEPGMTTTSTTTCCTVSQAIQQMPVLGYIPLGTGNGVGPVVGCKLKRFSRFRKGKQRKEIESLFTALQKASEDLSLIQNNVDHQYHNTDTWSSSSSSSPTIIKLPIMEVTTTMVNHEKKEDTNVLCFFAGVGFDSLMLNDYKELQSWSKQTGILTRFLSSIKGYCVALILKTLPAAILKNRHNIHVKVTCPSDIDNALWIDHRRGDFVQKITNATLYEGKTGILAAGTSPFYGGGLRLFPFARMTLDKMHLRLGRIHPAIGFFNIPSIFAGSYRDTSDRFGVLDFMLTDVEVEVITPKESDEKGFPFQHSGESVGLVERFRMRVVKEPVKFVCLRRQR